MNKFVVYLAVALVGFSIGAATCYDCLKDRNVVEKVDTLYIEKPVSIGKDELAEGTKEVAPPKPTKEYVFVPLFVPDTDTVTVHDTVFVMAKRRYYYTESDGVAIWHSGLSSRIDSVEYTQRTYVINKVSEVKPMNILSAGLEAGYLHGFQMPFYLQYERKVNDWLSVYGRAEYELVGGQFGGRIGTRASLTF